MTDNLEQLVRISHDLLKIRGEWCVNGIDSTLSRDIRNVVADTWKMMRSDDDAIMADAILRLERMAIDGEREKQWGPPFAVTVKHTIPPKEIAYQFIAAIEGGSNYWCSRIVPKEYRQTKEKPWYADPEVWADPTFVILVTEAGDVESDDVIHEITQGHIAKGLQALAETHPQTFKDIVDDNADADTADIFLQMVVFGEARYA